MPARKFTEFQAVQALYVHYGNVNQAAKALGVAHPTLWNRIKRSKRLQEARVLAEEQALDLAEESLMKAVKSGEAWAVCFLLKTRGKKREPCKIGSVNFNKFYRITVKQFILRLIIS